MTRLDPDRAVAALQREPAVPRADEGEVACARDLCRDGYTVHGDGGGACFACPCLGMLWVPPAGPMPERRHREA